MKVKVRYARVLFEIKSSKLFAKRTDMYAFRKHHQRVYLCGIAWIDRAALSACSTPKKPITQHLDHCVHVSTVLYF